MFRLMCADLVASKRTVQFTVQQAASDHLFMTTDISVHTLSQKQLVHGNAGGSQTCRYNRIGI